MIRLITTWPLLFCLLSLTSPALALTVQFNGQAQVNQEIVLLGDIATITPSGKEEEQWAGRKVSHAPAPGQSKILPTSSLIASLRYLPGADHIQWKGAKEITIQRQSVEVSEEQLKEIIADFLQRQLDKLPDVQFRFTSIQAPKKIILPTGEVTHTVIPSKPEILGSSSFSILFQANGKTVKNCTVRGKLAAIARVVTAKSTIRRGSIINARQLSVSQEDITRLDRPYQTIEQVVGMQAKRTIRTGTPLDGQNVTQPPVIRRGEPVKIIASKGSLQVSTYGVAIMDGRRGEFIQVKNIHSNKRIYCKVDAPGIVSVEF